MRHLQPVTFLSQGAHPVRLEGIFHGQEAGGLHPAAVVCHPHPLWGGSMHNPVVSAIAQALTRHGVLVLRFNFRGVGRSSGEYDSGRGEQADVAGALDWLLDQPQVDPRRVTLAGYSFGAWVALLQAQADPRVMAVASVSLAAWHYDHDFYRTSAGADPRVEDQRFEPNLLQSYTRPKLFVTGEQDPLAPPERLQRLVDRIPEPKRLHIIRAADHFLNGYEEQVAEVVARFLSQVHDDPDRRSPALL